MNEKEGLEARIRGWFPQELAINVINSKESQKPNGWLALPFPSMGAIMVVASLLSAYLGVTYVASYAWIYYYGPLENIHYLGLYIGIFSLVAFAVELYSGILLFAKKHITRALTGMNLIMALGVATLLVPILFDGLFLLAGIFLAAPMIISSVTALCITNAYNQKQKSASGQSPVIRQRIFAGLAIASAGLIAFGIAVYFQPFLFKQVTIITSLSIGIPLLVAAFLVRRTPKTSMVNP